MSIDVHEPTVDGSTIECDVTVPRRLRRFFTGDPFRIEYDVDMTGLPSAVASIPVLAHVCPVAWANGADVRVPAVDETFLTSLREVEGVLQGMYPQFIEGGDVHAGNVVDTRADRRPESFDDTGLLFSGGVDSVASYVRHREDDPTLISVQGWVVRVDQEERWEGVRRHVDRFAADRGLEVRAVHSNMLSCLEMPMLQAHFKRYVDGAWYSSVGHGLGLLALTAPLSYQQGLGTVHIASSHSEGFEEPWGSHPDIDDRVRWSHATGNHDGYELTRQDKVERIARYARAGDHEFAIRTCVHEDGGGNCNACEKCYRTMCGLVLAGLDPNRYGYEMDEGTFDEIVRSFERGAFVVDEHTKFHWLDLQEHVSFDREFPVAGATEFFRWLEAVDIDAVTESASRPSHQKLVRLVARNVPYPVYNSLYPLYDSIVNTVRTR